MKRPGDTGRQGYPIESLAVDAQATMAAARDLLADAQETMEAVDLPSDAAINLLDACRNDVFLWDSGPIPAEQRECDSSADATSFGLQRVVATNHFSPGLHVAPADAAPGDRAFDDPSEISAFAVGGYTRLVRDWLRGDVVPLREERRYFRIDTGEQYLTAAEFKTEIGDLATTVVEQARAQPDAGLCEAIAQRTPRVLAKHPWFDPDIGVDDVDYDRLRELAPKAPSEDRSDELPDETREWCLAFQAVAATVESTAIERVTVR